MNPNSQTRRSQQWWTGLTVSGECLIWWLVIPTSTAQTSEAPAFASVLTVASLPPEILPQRTAKRLEPRIPVLHRKRTDADAWEHFDAEFRLPKKSLSLVKRQVETAKYGLDVSVFSIDRFVKNLRDRADIHWEDGHWSRTSVIQPDPSRFKVRIKLDLDLTHGKPYLGARLVIPIGN